MSFWVDENYRERLSAAGLLELEAVLERDDLEPVKDALAERRVDRLALEDGSLVYLKRHLRMPPARPWRKSPVEAERQALSRLADLGIVAPRVLLAIEEGRQGLLVTLALPEAPTLEELLLAEPARAEIEAIAARLADLVRRLHAGGVQHRDFYLGHLRLDEDGEIQILDLDRARLFDRVPRPGRVKDLAALSLSAPGRLVSTFTRLRFLRRYLGEDLRRHRGLVRAIGRKTDRMRAHVRRQVERGRPNFHLND